LIGHVNPASAQSIAGIQGSDVLIIGPGHADPPAAKTTRCGVTVTGYDPGVAVLPRRNADHSRIADVSGDEVTAMLANRLAATAYRSVRSELGVGSPQSLRAGQCSYTRVADAPVGVAGQALLAVPMRSEPTTRRQRIIDLFTGIRLHGLLRFVWFDVNDSRDWRLTGPGAGWVPRCHASHLHGPPETYVRVGLRELLRAGLEAPPSAHPRRPQRSEGRAEGVTVLAHTQWTGGTEELQILRNRQELQVALVERVVTESTGPVDAVSMLEGKAAWNSL
jgi:hypothetical protein